VELRAAPRAVLVRAWLPQRDPQIYDAFAALHPGAVDAVAIRRLSVAQRVLSSGTPIATATEQTAAEPATDATSAAPAPPSVTGGDGCELRDALVQVGVLPRTNGAC
jgi:hypothetical protein